MKLVNDDGTEIDINKENFMILIDSTSEIITEGLIHKFMETTGIVKMNSIVPLAKEYCKMAKFLGKIELHPSYDIISEILESDTPYNVFKEKYKEIKIIKDGALIKWKDLIDKKLAQLQMQMTMFS